MATATAFADIPSLTSAGLIGIFGGMYAVALASGVLAAQRADPPRLAVLLLAPNLAVGFYAAARPYWAVLAYVVLLIFLVELAPYGRLARRLPDTAANRRLLASALARLLALLALTYGMGLVLANVAAATYLGTTDLVSGFVLGVTAIALFAVVAVAGREGTRATRAP